MEVMDARGKGIKLTQNKKKWNSKAASTENKPHPLLPECFNSESSGEDFWGFHNEGSGCIVTSKGAELFEGEIELDTEDSAFHGFTRFEM